ncbi:hypothetical protein QYF36_017435 [Acer negundo]|nr:hypothetical protein QYF36_017435 [Acer negundo]
MHPGDFLLDMPMWVRGKRVYLSPEDINQRFNLVIKGGMLCGFPKIDNLDQYSGTVFASHNLASSTHHTVNAFDTVKALHYINNYLWFNVGHIIHKAIHQVKRAIVGVIPFPCLITHACGEARILVFGLDEISSDPNGNLNQQTYNMLARARNLPTLPRVHNQKRAR